MIDVSELSALAAEIAREAGELALRRREEGVRLAATKSTLADIVTEADREVEVLIRRRITEARPHDGILGEEDAPLEGTSGITWVVDPIDGTVNYAKGLPNWCVSIAAVSGRIDPDAWQGEASAIFAPVLGEVFHAARDEGAWLGEQRLQVATEWPAGALLGTGFGYDPATHEGDLAMVRKVMPLARDVRRMGSAAIDLAYVAAGRIDGHFERGLQPWDFAGGALLVTEAGGVFRRLDTGHVRPLAVAAAPELHARITSVLGFG